MLVYRIAVVYIEHLNELVRSSKFDQYRKRSRLEKSLRSVKLCDNEVLPRKGTK